MTTIKTKKGRDHTRKIDIYLLDGVELVLRWILLMCPKPQLFEGNVLFSQHLLFVSICDCINRFRELIKLDMVIYDADRSDRIRRSTGKHLPRC